jgi:hypothetical protein
MMMWSRSRSRDPLRAVGAADRGVDGALDGERARLDQLRPLVDPVERGQVGDFARVGDGDELDELPVVLHRQRDPLLVRQCPQDLGRDRAAEVGVQLGEAFLVGHPPSLPASLRSRRQGRDPRGIPSRNAAFRFAHERSNRCEQG